MNNCNNFSQFSKWACDADVGADDDDHQDDGDDHEDHHEDADDGDLLTTKAWLSAA